MGKNIVILCDGTWNEPTAVDGGQWCPTNVVKIGLLVETCNNPERQAIFYDEGVGSKWYERIRGGFGHGLSKNVRQGYEFLIRTYVPGDSLFLFGFSRGAFTARSLAALVGKCGIVKDPKNASAVDAAWDHYQDSATDNAGKQEAREKFRAANCVKRDRKGMASPYDIEIAFLGVFDTVGSMGIPSILGWDPDYWRYRFHDQELGPCVMQARHAVSIDEMRSDFSPVLWLNAADPTGRIRQVWFPGAHCDVGGGYKGPFRWADIDTKESKVVSREGRLPMRLIEYFAKLKPEELRKFYDCSCSKREDGLENGALWWMMKQAGAAGLKYNEALLKAWPACPKGVPHSEVANTWNPFFWYRQARRTITGREPGLALSATDKDKIAHPYFTVGPAANEARNVLRETEGVDGIACAHP